VGLPTSGSPTGFRVNLVSKRENNPVRGLIEALFVAIRARFLESRDTLDASLHLTLTKKERETMDEKTCRLLLGRHILAMRRTGPDAMRTSRKMHAGEICNSCRGPLPHPQTPGSKRCASCVNSHHVRMTFSFFRGWHCRFFSKRWKVLPKSVVFRDAASIWETARRGNGLIDDEDRKYLTLSIELGSGGIMLRLSDEQLVALGGELPSTIDAGVENTSSSAVAAPDQR